MAGWVIAINPMAGRHALEPERLRAALDAAGVDAEVEAPPDRRAMISFLKAAIDYPRVAVAGGDGTINLAINSWMEVRQHDLPVLGMLPAGTGSDLIRTFGLPQRLEDAVSHLAGDLTYTADLVELTGAFGIRRFINVAQAGVGAAAVVTSASLWRGLGAQRYITAFGLRLPGFKTGEVNIETDRRSHTGRACAVIMANAQFFAGGWNVAPKATLIDGVLDLQIIDVSKMAAPALVPKLVKGLHLAHPGVRRITASRFRLETEHSWPVEVDGDAIGNTPIDGRVLPAAIRLKI